MQTKKGFTLIELLVVVLIIGILAAVALPQYRVAVEKARMSEAMVVLRSIQEAEVRYHLANGVYTTQIDEIDISLPSTTTHNDRANLPSGITVSIAGATTANKYIHAENKSHTNTLIFYLTGGRQCHAKQNDKVANQVCKSLGGTNPTDSDGCSIGSCTIYDL